MSIEKGKENEVEVGKTSNFIWNIIENDIANNKNDGKVLTRFPPEPNGYLHIGHAKAISLDFGTALRYNGKCNLRFDDTNPDKEDPEFEEAIKRDVKWLGYDWEDRLFYASDYFEKIYEYAIKLIKDGKAYVDDLTADEIREYRGTLTEPGKNSPWRERTVEENLVLFERMRKGEFKDGEKVLRAKIDMASPNINLRDPVMYRIKRAHHYRKGDEWLIYPTYDFTHGQSDSIEGITHSLCYIGIEDHRPLYNWFVENLGIHHPQQIEFARLNLSYTVLSKRKLRRLVEEGHVKDWDDPRMPTLAGFRRRGYTPEAIRDFCERIGVAKRESIVDLALLEHCLREDLNKRAPRYMAVLNPLKMVITNYPDDLVEEIEAINNPEDESQGKRIVPFSKIVYIEREDFMEEPPKKFFRLAPGREVRLRYAYYIKCTDVVKDENGEITEIHCTHDPETKGGWSSDGRKVKSTIHWVAEKQMNKAEVRLYENLFINEDPEEVEGGGDFLQNVNPNSLAINENALIEPELNNLPVGAIVQFERMGYFCVDKDSTNEKKVFNRTVTLKDTWAKIQKK
ncbi:MAG: glutamine--tRNA ligase/YqeY domain fusion protein [Candidatus Cloacimonetes bacterium]|nr:glutamine--tRNA ligase/YqeY domain fusion protein [Candidatus Cloacimonadota bacterium]